MVRRGSSRCQPRGLQAKLSELLSVAREYNTPNNKDGGARGELVRLSASLEVYLSPDGVVEVDLAVDHVRERWRARV